MKSLISLSSLQSKILSTEMEQKLIFAVILGEIRKHVAIELKMQPGPRQISFQSVLPIIVPIIS